MRRKGYQRRESRGSGRIRIVGGRWRGRHLRVADVPDLRPTADRVRETLFNWLQADIDDARVLDLFAGTGALGIEAVSRGAARALLVENDRRAAAALRSLITDLDPERLELIQTDALRWLDAQQAGAAATWDLVLLDPPFDRSLHATVLERLLAGALLGPGSLIWCEYPARSDAPWDERFEALRELRAGDVAGALLRPRAAALPEAAAV